MPPWSPAPPWSILAITFTNKAAGELKERLERMLGPAANDIWAATFHSACVRILRRDIDRLGFSSSFTIYDTDDSVRVIKECLKDLNLDDKTFSAPVRAGATSPGPRTPCSWARTTWPSGEGGGLPPDQDRQDLRASTSAA